MSGQPGIVQGQWVVTLRHYLPNELKTNHVSHIASLTADAATPFNCEIQSEFQLGELKGYAAKCDDTTKQELERLPEIVAIEPMKRYAHCSQQANAPWGLGRISTRSKLGAPPYTYKYRDDASGAGAVAYIIDTGINDAHVEFEGRARKGPKFVSTDPSGDEDVHGHGTHVAGTVASRAYGVAKKAGVVGVKVFSDQYGTAQTNDIIAALEWVVEDAKNHPGKAVVNMSLGGPESDALDNAVDATIRAGVIVCVAAGNEKSPAETTSPARTPLAITVGATSVNDTIASWSNYGKMVDVLAPGVDILSCWIGSPTATNTISGTSMATPHVAGAVACLLSGKDDNKVDEVMGELLILADKNKISGFSTQAVGRTVNALLHNSTSAADN
ncbi:putative Alkaline serine protease (PR1) [Pleurostoma richardsiae]|uniref:Alkaline serine protease (PR1) n=1 Tax=Pleurostoma richardsiae TaxID=41990 RepID=A0AA38R4S8_9PEZI|nr:putative Alkaline serine protease (PR1) [Pleurostoma richardsiae]